MISVRVPLRISFLGGGTDYRSWSGEYGGRVLTTTINKYVYVSLRKLPHFFKHRVRVSYSQVEHVPTAAEIDHPVFREVFRHTGVLQDVESHYDADLPGRAGMGSSSAFTVGLLHAIYGWRGSDVSPMRLAQEAMHVEQHMIGDVVGCQDQVTAAYGGFNLIDFASDGSISVTPADVDDRYKAELERSVMLVYTGLSRHASQVAETYARDLVGTHRGTMHAIRETVDVGCRYLKNGDVDAFGRLLDEAWSLKKQVSRVISNEKINAIYDAAKRAGASGGKLLGAGGGGFVLLIVRPDRRADVREALKDLQEIHVRFERDGSRIVYCQLNGTL